MSSVVWRAGAEKLWQSLLRSTRVYLFCRRRALAAEERLCVCCLVVALTLEVDGADGEGTGRRWQGISSWQIQTGLRQIFVMY